MNQEPDLRLAPARTPWDITVNLALLTLFLLAAWFQLGLHLGGMFEDDAYFYFRIARNIVAGAGISFDSIATTNGFHLAWMGGLAAALSVLWPLLPFDVAVVLASALPVLVFAFSLRPFWFLCVLAALVFVGFGMEGVLAAALAIGFCRMIDARRTIAVGAMAAALVLARIDLVILLGVIIAWFMSRRDRLWLAIALGMAAGLAANVAINLWLVGEPFSISSSLKSSSVFSWGAGQAIRTVLGNFASPGNQIRLLIYVVPLAWIAWQRRRGKKDGGFAAHPAFLLGSLAFLSLHSGFSALRDWYFAVPVLTALWAAGQMDYGAAFSSGWAVRAAILIPCAILPLAAAIWFQLSTLDEARSHRIYLERLDRALPQDAPLYVYDASGFAGHVLWPRPVINGDGLVNSFEYIRIYDEPEKLFDYFEATGTRHFLSELHNPLCVTPWVCCEPGSVTEIIRFPPNRWVQDKRAWVFRKGHGCQLSIP